ncbi:MAG: alpha/beta hydrolase, partial [Deltaproteobacteria bacterium]|nr:alpha/beta hydrolase [Deltaproteobacteria bacterium]
FEVNGYTLISLMVEGAFYGPAYPAYDTAYLPLLINEVSQGHTELLLPWVEAYVSRWGKDDFSWGLYFSINCHEEAPSISPEKLKSQSAIYPELDGYSRHSDELAVCNAWGLDPAPPLAAEPVISDIPVLVLAGTYDPITPPEWSRTAITNMAKSTMVEFPSAGHSVVTNNPCARQIISTFLNNPTIEPDISCMVDTPQPQFVLPDEIIVASAIYEIHYAEIGYSKLEENLFLGSLLTLLGSGVIALFAGLIKLVRRDQTPQTDRWVKIALPLLIILAATAGVWGFQLRASLRSTAATASNTLRFGLPDTYWWLFIMVLIIGLMTIGMIVITALAWKRKNWSLLGRIAFSLSTLAAITFSGVLVNWNLFTPLFR